MALPKQTDGIRKPRGQWSIARYLLAVATVSIVPSFIFAGVLIQRNQAAQEDVVETLIVSTSRAIIQAVEREISANITTLKVLANSPSLTFGDFQGFHQRSTLALADTGANLFIVNPDFSTFASTRQPFDAPPGTASDAASLERAFASKQVVVTDLVLGSVSKQWVYNILLPVDLGANGNKLIALNQRADNFASVITSNNLPAGWNAALLDNKHQVLAGTPGAGARGDTFGAFTLTQVSTGGTWREIEGTDGQSLLGVIQRSPTTGWLVVAWAPRAVIAQPLLMSVLYLVGGAVILLALVVAALLWVSRRIATSVRGLARDARRLGAGDVVHARPYPVREIAEVSEALALASTQRQSAEREVHYLLRELAHRSKNQMTVIAAMAKQTARGAQDLPGYVQAFERRILGLAKSTDLLLAHGHAGVTLTELVESQLAPFSPREKGRVTIEGPVVRLNAQAAQTLGMALHELSTNAVKYGAFAGDDGKLTVRWILVDDHLDLVWRETVSTLQAPSERVGFGTTVLKTIVGSTLRSKVDRMIHDDGIEWRFAIPLDALQPGQVPATHDADAQAVEREAAAE